MMRLVVLLVFLSIYIPAFAETISGKVISVADGDTLTILNSENIQIKVRLAAIDAPEKAQAFGNRSKQSLSDMCFGRLAKVDVVDTDRYGRTVGTVTCGDTQANDAQVASGMAWVYRKYAEGFGHLYPLEESAKASRRGLWSDQNPIPPWQWRKQRGGGKHTAVIGTNAPAIQTEVSDSTAPVAIRHAMG